MIILRSGLDRTDNISMVDMFHHRDGTLPVGQGNHPCGQKNQEAAILETAFLGGFYEKVCFCWNGAVRACLSLLGGVLDYGAAGQRYPADRHTIGGMDTGTVGSWDDIVKADICGLFDPSLSEDVYNQMTRYMSLDDKMKFYYILSMKEDAVSLVLPFLRQEVKFKETPSGAYRLLYQLRENANSLRWLLSCSIRPQI